MPDVHIWLEDKDGVLHLENPCSSEADPEGFRKHDFGSGILRSLLICEQGGLELLSVPEVEILGSLLGSVRVKIHYEVLDDKVHAKIVMNVLTCRHPTLECFKLLFGPDPQFHHPTERFFLPQLKPGPQFFRRSDHRWL